MKLLLHILHILESFSDDILFYFMSRGISKKTAYELLIRALLINQGSLDANEVKKMIEKIEMI